MKRVKLSFKGKKGRSKTQQNFRDDVNVNTIMAKAKRTGILPQTIGGQFRDVSSGLDYKESLDKIMEIDGMFSKLPAKIRTRFQNNPSEIVEFLQNPDNDKEARELGLLEPLSHEEQLAQDVKDGIRTPDGKVIPKEEKPKEPEAEG